MNTEAAQAEDEVENVIAELGIGKDLACRLVKRPHIAYYAHKVNAFKYHLQLKIVVESLIENLG
jgi:hypothetical protein